MEMLQRLYSPDPSQASYGVLPTTDRVGVWFLRLTATESANGQRFFEYADSSSIHHTLSMIVQFARLTTPFD